MELHTLKQEAGDLLARGKFAQAEVLYRQMLLLHPRDAQLWVRHAEALKRLSRVDDAVESYKRAAAMLAESGHFPRAVAALKLALELRGDDLDLISELIRMELKKNHREARSATAMAMTAAAPTAPSVPPAREEAEPLLALPVLEEAITNPGITIEVLPSADEWPQVRRISARAVGLKAAPDARWVVIQADSEVTVTFADDLDEFRDPEGEPS